MDCFLFTSCLLLMFGVCSARVVTVSPGPLIRVDGQPVSIRCDVTEYGGADEQDFEWTMSNEITGPKTKIISTFDASYSHPSLSKRVASGDISVMRLRDNEAELKIAEVKLTDAGFYWCQTPSTDSVISGNYEAQVQLIVIPNTLSVSPRTPLPVVSEGSKLTLTCLVTRQLTHPTYLSITLSVKKGETSEKLLTFGPDVSSAPAPQLAQRFTDGGIRLVPSGKAGELDLVISKVVKSDEGVYECSGAEWTHEARGKWVKIVESTKEMGPVAVSSVVLSPPAQDKCEKYVAIGENFSVPLNHKLQSTDHLEWKRDTTVLFRRQSNRQVRAGKAEDISADGSLMLTNVQEHMSGTYKPKVFNEAGQGVKNLKSLNLCVIARVKKPKVTMQCKESKVIFTCMTEESSHEWLQNNKTLNEKEKSLKSLTKEAKDVSADSFTCRVSNQVSSLTSEPVTQHCYTESSVCIHVVRAALFLLLAASSIIISVCYRDGVKTKEM